LEIEKILGYASETSIVLFPKVINNISISIKEKKVDKITMKNSPDAVMYPIKELPPQELILKDFIWRGAERPAKNADLIITR
jgi:hypothetical protein